MANIRYDVPCPSCEATVPIRSTSAIGKKIECPKCKYRFIAPEPPEDGDEDDGGAVKTKKKEGTKKGKKAKAGGNTMVIVGVLLGVFAVGALVFGGWLLLGNDSTPPSTPKPGANSGGSGSTGTTSGSSDTGDSPKLPTEGGPTKSNATSAAEAAKGKDITNLLPGDTVAVYRVNMDRTAKVATPLANAAVDNYTRDLFQSSFAINADNVATYIHCVTKADREPFAVIRTRSPFSELELYQKLQLEQPKNQNIRGRSFFLIKSNPFIEAVSRAFTTRALAGLLGIALPPDPPGPTGSTDKQYALCVYDTQTLLVSTELIMERFLTDLKDDGFPPFQSELIPVTAAEPPPADPAAPMGGMPPPGGSIGPMPMPPGAGSGPGRSMSDPVRRFYDPQGPMPQPGGGGKGGPPGPPVSAGLQPMGPGGPGGPGAPAGPPPRRLYTSLPTYRTIDPALKKMLNQIEEDEQNPPAILYAEIIDQRILNSRQLGAAYQASGNIAHGLLSQIKIVGVALLHLNKDKGDVRLFLEYVSPDDAKKSVTKHILPVLTLGQVFGQPLFGTTIAVKNNVGSNASGNGPNGIPPPGGGSLGPPPPGGGSLGPPPPGGSEGPMPMPPMGGTFQPGSGFGPNPLGQKTDSAFTVDIADTVVTISATINWSEEKYAAEVLARINRMGSQVKGRMAVLSGEVDFWQYLGMATPKVDKKGFPRGTIEREMREERYRLPFPPEQRVSFMAELLPYIGRNNVRVRIQDKRLPWYAKENLPAAETWVPEFLVPYYPQDSWRAHHVLAEGTSLGGTNYAGLAGIGLDAARYDPNDTEMAKKVGVVGYDWGSKTEEIKDGTSNTIFMIQTAPGIGRAWIAGGGSTILGVDDNNDPMKPFVHKTPTGARGTNVLMADGSVRWLKEGTDPKLFKAMVTRAGGETMGDLDAAAPKLKAVKPLDTELRPAGSPGSPTTTSGAEAVDAAELKKFQGKWRATALMAQGKSVPKEAIGQMMVEVVFEGDRSSFAGKGLPGDVSRINKIDPTTKPKQIDMKSSDGMVQSLVYEFTNDRKLKMRGSPPGSPRPTAVTMPEAGSRDLYMELELADK